MGATSVLRYILANIPAGEVAAYVCGKMRMFRRLCTAFWLGAQRCVARAELHRGPLLFLSANHPPQATEEEEPVFDIYNDNLMTEVLLLYMP